MMLIDLREAIRREVDVLDGIGLVSGVIRRSNPFCGQLLVHLPHDQLPVTEQHSVLGFLIPSEKSTSRVFSASSRFSCWFSFR